VPISATCPKAPLLATRLVAGVTLRAHVAHDLEDQQWDDFLQSSAFGHFQQSAVWSSIKSLEGWRSVRVVVRSDTVLVAGFQLLWRKRSMFREGFVNKGPVAKSPTEEITTWLLELLQTVLRRERIDLLLLQPPDADQWTSKLCGGRGYAPNVIADIITATFCIPLQTDGLNAESRMRRSIQLENRQGLKRGVLIREATAADIPTFFDMMAASARRQKSLVNPSTPNALHELWHHFHIRGLARLTLAEHAGKPLAGLLTIRFGDRITQWKKGWTGEGRDKHPNTVLALESIAWSETIGARLVDFAGGNRAFVSSLLKGIAPNEAQKTSRDFYLVGLGAEGRLLPEGRIYLRTRLARLAYGAVSYFLRVRRRTK
jgi:hypothetical protein